MDDASKQGVDAQVGRTRAALALIGMVAAQRPDTLQHNLDTLLQAGNDEVHARC